VTTGSKPRSSVELRCDDFGAALEALGKLGLRVDMIMPADSPRLAELSSPDGDVRIHLVGPELERTTAWRGGRAGMEYRDLVPPGRLIASHIRVRDGGPVPDYVHYHAIRFQMIYCHAGWVRLVYEDQGEPFVMQAGECVLQPPTIRHRVLECSPGLEVIEVATPAEHATFADHAMTLPNGRRERAFEGQRFVHLKRGWGDREMFEATGGIADVRWRRGGTVEPGSLGIVVGATVEALTAGSPDGEWLEITVR